MRAKTLIEVWHQIHARLCYQLFITPIHFPIEKEYRNFVRRAEEFFNANRTDSMTFEKPRHYVIHRFKPTTKNDNPKKILIAHGWISRAVYMARLIYALNQQGYEVYAIDFPAHGEAKGLQLTWTDAVKILQHAINNLGPFYGVIGHSFGGSMLLNTLNLSTQFEDWKIHHDPQRVVLLSAPTRMRVPVAKMARRFKLSARGFFYLRQLFREQAIIDLKNLNFRPYGKHSTTPFLCIHGENDDSIRPIESTIFCNNYPNATLVLLPGADHVSVLIDERVESKVCQFLSESL